MSRPRLSLGAPPAVSTAEPTVPAVVPVPVIDGDPLEVGERWVRPSSSVDTVSSPTPMVLPVPASTGVTGVFRRSPAKKRNRTVSVPAETVTWTRTAARAAGLSLSDFTFVAVEEFCERLRSSPRLADPQLGRVVAPRGATATKAHMVLYLADDEWEKWRDLAARGGMGTISALVSTALTQR